MTIRHSVTLFGRSLPETYRLKGVLFRDFESVLDPSQKSHIRTGMGIYGEQPPEETALYKTQLFFKKGVTYHAALQFGRKMEDALNNVEGADVRRVTDPGYSHIGEARYGVKLLPRPGTY